ncbi:hypothetical protein QJS83_16045 [Bdellovibrio sp. 22V]|uniref:hypothetical protein n=1 Tax=Bdellovibrio sp. 22V TaxID=3044166 RepID=UPI002543AE4D|nr:hypothetical protein [Bdellovibrio sp. 22V]WII71975.1 hypothetical protein QJS83_16045 [Bdellovibrio sp. 22V]
MKLFLKSMIMLFACSSALASGEVQFNARLNNTTGEEAILAFYAEYEATRALPGCKSYGLPEGEFKSDFKTKQRLHFFSGSDVKAAIPVQFGICAYKMTHTAVIVISPIMYEGMQVEGRAKEVEPGVLEFKGGLPGNVPVKSGKVSQTNVINCGFPEADSYAARCDVKEIISNGSSVNVNVNLIYRN